jgi:hypothetical protein
VLRLVVLWAPIAAPKLPLESADGDEAESGRARLRERCSVPGGDDGAVELANHQPGGGGCCALLVCPAAWTWQP